MSAAENNQLDFVKWLMKKGADVGKKMKSGWTAMHVAAKNNRQNILDELVRGGGDEEILSTIPWSDEDKIVLLMRYKPEGFKDTLKEAIAQVSDVNEFRSWRDTNFSLLFHTSLSHCPEAVEFLLEKDADPSLCNDRGACVLHLMAKRGQLEMAQMCYSKVTAEKRHKFVNGGTGTGIAQ